MWIWRTSTKVSLFGTISPDTQDSNVQLARDHGGEIRAVFVAFPASWRLLYSQLAIMVRTVTNKTSTGATQCLGRFSNTAV